MGIRVGSWRAPRAPAAGAASGFPSPSLFLLFHTGTAILVIMLFLNTGRPLGDAALLTASCGFVLLVAWQLGLTVWLLKVTGRLKPLPPDLAALVEEQSARHGIPVRNVFQLDMPMSNAFALPWSGDLAFSARLPKILGTDELKSIISHELGHLRESALYRWGRLLGAFQLTAVGLLPSIVVSFGFKGLAVGFVGYILIGRLGLKLSRMAELAADRTALAGESNGEVYAYALERIHKDNLIPAVMGGNETHPDLCHRMKQAGVTPDYPRLGPPSKSLGVVCMGLAIILAILLNNVFQFLFPLQ